MAGQISHPTYSMLKWTGVTNYQLPWLIKDGESLRTESCGNVRVGWKLTLITKVSVGEPRGETCHCHSQTKIMQQDKDPPTGPT